MLCVDRNVEACRAISIVLLEDAVTVECVPTPGEALKVLHARSHLCQLVIASNELPGSSGLILARDARRAGFKGEIIITCAGIARKTAEAYRVLGISSILVRPISPPLLRAAVEIAQRPAAIAASA